MIKAPGEPLEHAATLTRGRPSIAGIVAGGYIVLLVALAIFAPWIAPHDPNAQNLLNVYRRPGWGTHLLGTDKFGRDEISRLIFGTRISLIAALIGTGVAAAIGAPSGMIAGFLGGKVEGLFRFANDAIMSVPSIIFALTVIAVVGPGLVHAMIAVGVILSPAFFRLARAATIDIKNETFIEASAAVGCSTWRTVRKHVLPNALSPIIIQMSVVAGVCIVAEASLSYLGFGVQPPTASWGSMLSNATDDLYSDPSLVYFPGLAVASAVLAFMVLGDSLRDSFGTGRGAQT